MINTLLLENIHTYDKAKWQLDGNVGTINLANHFAFLTSVVNYMEKKKMITMELLEVFDNSIDSQSGTLMVDMNNLSLDSSMFTSEGNKILQKNYKRWQNEFHSNGFINFK